jgi:hypothetical protein
MAEGDGTAGTVAWLLATTAWLASWDTSELKGEPLLAAVLAHARLLNAAHARSSALLDQLEQDGAWAADGALSAAQWTAGRTGASPVAMWSKVRQGEALRLLPALAERARAGWLSVEHLHVLGDCVRRHPELVTQHERFLAEQAESLDAGRFRVTARARLEQADEDRGMKPPARASDDDGTGREAVEPSSRLHASRTVEGCLRLDGWFVPADADVLDAALGAGDDRQLRAAADGDPSVAGRPVSSLRAAALVDLAAQSMRREPSDLSAPDRYRVAVVVRAGEATSPPEAACDAAAYRAVLGERSEVLDIGHQSPRWPSAIRRAITLRDGGCVFPGCDRPPSWADIHHCTPFSEEGPTNVDNGALLCRRHHRFVHARGWRIAVEDGAAIVRRPDGQPHAIRRWQPRAEGGDMAAQPPTARPPPASAQP